MVKSFSILSFVLIIIIGLSCKKETDENFVKPKTSTKLLTQAPWKLVNAQIKVNNGAWQGSYDLLPGCNQDNILDFPTDSTYNISEGNSKCNAGDPDIIRKGRWEFINKETKIKYTDTYITYNMPAAPNDTVFAIREQFLTGLGENILKLTEVSTNSNGDFISNEFIYSH